MKNHIALFLLCFSSLSFCSNELPISHQLLISEDYATSSYTIKNKGELIARIYDTKISVDRYQLYAPNGKWLLSSELDEKSNPIRLSMFNESIKGVLHQSSSHDSARAFVLYDASEKTQIIKGVINYWGTEVTLYDIKTKQPFAKMNSDYWCSSCSWRFELTDPDLFKSVQVESDIFLMTIALRGQHWCNTNVNLYRNIKQDMNTQVEAQTKLTEIATLDSQLYNEKRPSKKLVNKLIKEIDEAFFKTNIKNDLNKKQEIIESKYYEFCLQYLKSQKHSYTNKQALFYLLKQKLSQEMDVK